MELNKKFTKKEKVLIFILFLIASFSLIIFWNYKSIAFPEYNINFTINRKQASDNSRQFLTKVGLFPKDYKEATIFDIDNTAKTYLEREIGATNTGNLAKNQIDIWHFNTRFFKPLQKEEYVVLFLPSGRLSGFVRQLEDDRQIPSLDKNQAQLLAEKFLQNFTIFGKEELKLVNTDIKQQKTRTDYTFTWKKEGLAVKNAGYQIRVGIAGNQLKEYSEFLKVPDEWQRLYQKERSNNDLAQQAAETIFILLFGIGGIITFILGFKKRDLRYKAGLIIGVTTSIVSILTTLNSLPLLIYQYATTASWNAFVGSIIILSITGSIATGGINFLIITTGEHLYRKYFPEKISLANIFGKGIFTKEVGKSIVVGSLYGIITLAYVTYFYIIGSKFGAWSPVEVNYSDIFSTYFPAIYPLYIGVSAAVFEEGIFRLFGIPFLTKYLKKSWLAILITAFAWSFLHSNYPQSPWFIRGIEVGFNGIILGIIFVRFGILASLFAHFIYDALLTAFFITSSNNILTNITSMSVALSPFIIFIALYIIYKKRKGFAAETALLNAYYTNKQKIFSKKEEKISTYSEYSYKALSKKYIYALIALTIFSITTFIFLPDTGIKSQPSKITRSDAEAIAEKALEKKGIKINKFYKVTSFIDARPEKLQQEYILEKSGYRALQSIFPQKIPTALWHVRFFRALQKEEYALDLLPDGKIYKIKHTISEDALGANLTPQEARLKTKKFLEKEIGLNFTNLKLINNFSQKQKNRTDYFFSYEETKSKIGDAKFITDVAIQGDEPTNFDQYIKIPEDWLREKEKTTTKNLLINTTFLVALSFLLVHAFVTFLKLIRSNLLKIRIMAKYTAPFILLFLLNEINQLPSFFAGYNTAIPSNSFVAQQIIGIIIGTILLFLFMTSILGMFAAMWRLRFGQFFPKEKRDYIKDGVIIAYTISIISITSERIITFLGSKLDLGSISLANVYSSEIDAFSPAFSEINSVLLTCVSVFGLIIVIFLLLKIFKTEKNLLFTIFIAIVLGVINTTNIIAEKPAETFLNLIGGISAYFLLTIIIYFLIKKIIRTNLVGYVGIVYAQTLITIGIYYLNQQNQFFWINGISLLFLAFIPLFYSFKVFYMPIKHVEKM